MKKIFILSLFSIFFITLAGFAKIDYVYVGTYDNEVYLLNSANEIIWTYSEFTDDVESITMDDDRNIYAISPYGQVHKIDPNGNQVWVYISQAIREDSFIHVDSNGNVYIPFLTKIRKLDNDANLIWTQTVDYVYGIDVDSDGNVYVGTKGEGLFKLDSDGDIIWSNKIEAGSDVYDVYLDSNNNVFAVNSIDEIIKFDTDGNFVVSEAGLSTTRSLIVDNNDNVYVGNRSGTIELVKYDNHLNEIWSREVNEPIYSFYVDENNFVYTGGANDIIKYSPSGIRLWEINSDFNRIAGLAVYRDYRYDATTTGLLYLLPTLYTISIISGGFVFAIVRKNENRMQSIIETSIFIVLGLSLLPIIIAMGAW